jgi:hypothetical protein
VALENSEDGIMKTPVVVETSAVLDWIFYGVHVDGPGLGASGSNVYFSIDGQQVVIS